MYSSIIWDFDGTLFDTYPSMAMAFQNALSDYGIYDSRDNIMKYTKISLGHAIEHYGKSYNLDENFVLKFKSYEAKIDKAVSSPMPFAEDFCRKFKNVGGLNFIYTHRGNSIFQYLEYYGMRNLFADIVTGDFGLKRKPDPEGFLYIINKHKLGQEYILAVGDRELDIKAAHNAGIKSCLLDSGYIVHDTGAHYKIKSLDELYEIVCQTAYK